MPDEVDVLQRKPQHQSTSVSGASPAGHPEPTTLGTSCATAAEVAVVANTEPMSPKSSQRKIAANRLNALKSTGPKSLRGKKISALNAVRHGLLSRQIVIDGPDGKESFRDFEELFAAQVDALQPGSEAELLVVWEIAAIKLRLRRGTRYEAARIRRQIENAVRDSKAALERKLGDASSDEVHRKQVAEEEQLRLEAMIETLVLPPFEELDRLDRHERTLEQRLFRKYLELDRLKRIRLETSTSAGGS